MNGTCPATVLLASYAAGELSEKESASLAEHLAECGQCDYFVRRLKAFDQPESSGPEWPEVSPRLQTNFERALDAVAPDPNKRHSLWRWFRSPVPAYSFAMILLYPAWLGISSLRLAAPLVPSIENPRVVRLDSTRSAQVSSDIAPSGDGSLTLLFFVPVKEGLIYSASLFTQNHKRIAGPLPIRSYDGFGNFFLPCKGVGNHPEGLTLEVTETAGGAAVPRVISFPFQP